MKKAVAAAKKQYSASARTKEFDRERANERKAIDQNNAKCRERKRWQSTDRKLEARLACMWWFSVNNYLLNGAEVYCVAEALIQQQNEKKITHKKHTKQTELRSSQSETTNGNL